MNRPLLWDLLTLHGRRLHGDCVTRNGCELVVPEPSQGLLAGLNPHEARGGPLAERDRLLHGELLVRLGETATDEEDVARTETDALLTCHFLDQCDGDDGALKGRECKAVAFGVGGEVQKDTAADYTAGLDPFCCSVISQSPSARRTEYPWSPTVDTEHITALNRTLSGAIVENRMRLVGCGPAFSMHFRHSRGR